MSYAIVLVFEGVSEADYWKVNETLGINRDGSGDWPDGIKSHAAGPTPNGWVVVEKWESKAAQEAFMASRLGAAIAAAGLPAPAQVIETNTVNDKHID
ncbi:MAG: hypothetical protein JJD93_15360 [Ilumatobacteraceae bacterium]|nr:hypothetical protein [Ilumatobacteraceae bacterium]